MSDALAQLFCLQPPWPRPDTTIWTGLASELGVDPGLLKTLLYCIDAPASLQCLTGALRSLQLWLPEVQVAGGFSPEELRQWQGLSSSLLAALQARGRDGTWRDEHELVFRASVRNLCEAHPYYAALVSVAGMGAYAPPMCRILVRVWRELLCAHDNLSEHQRIAIGRALRALYDRRGPRPQLSLGPHCTDTELAQALGGAMRGVDSTGREQLLLLQRLLSGSLARSERHGGGGGGHGGGTMRGRPRLQDRVVLDDLIPDPGCPEEEISSPRSYRVEARTTRPDGREFETEPQGAAPGDSGATSVYAYTPGDSGTSLRPRLDRLAKRVDAHAIAADVAMRSQPLRHRWGLLTPAELAAFFAGIDQLLAATIADHAAKPARGAHEAQLCDRSLAVLLMTMLIRGIEPAEAVKMHLVVDATVDPVTGSVASSGELLCAARPGSRQARWHWEHTPDPCHGGEVRNTELVRPTAERLRLPLQPPFAALFRLALSENWKSRRAGEFFPLVQHPKRVIKRVADWCAKLNCTHGTRLTAHRISHFLPWRAAAECQLDPVMVALMRGRADLTSATQAYYQQTDPDILANSVSAFWQGVVGEVLIELPVAPPAWLATPWPQQALDLDSGGPGIGSKKVPTRATVRRVIAYLLKNLRSANAARQIAPWEHLRAYHNAYTLYTLHFHLWATGARAARDPLPDLRFVEPVSQLVLLCDKSAADAYSSRLVWVCPEYLAHLNYYRAHLEVVAKRMLVDRSDQYVAHRRTLEHWRGAGPPGAPDGGIVSLFYELFDTGPEILTPELATDVRMPPDLALPPNCNRHYLRTALRERGCRGDLVDAQLGHWHHGTEPWGASSSLTPRAFARVMRGYLEPLIRDLGFRAMPSVLTTPAARKGHG